MGNRRDRLVERREAVGLSQGALADLVGVARSTVFRWEAGDTDPRPWLRPCLARALRITVNELDSMLLDDVPLVTLEVERAPQVAGIEYPQQAAPEARDEQGSREQMHRRHFIQGVIATTAGLASASTVASRLTSSGPLAVDHLAASVQRLTRLEHRSQYTALQVLLPNLAAETDHLLASAMGVERLEVLSLQSRIRMVEAFTHIKQDRPEHAHAVAAEALALAQEANDPVLAGASLRCMGEVHMRAGDYELATDLALEGARLIGQSGASGRAATAIEGAGLLSAATACARSGNRADATALLTLAGESADRLREDVVGTVVFGPTNVAVHNVALEVELGDPPSALHHAESWQFPARSGMHERHARYLLDVARAQALCGDGVGATSTLLEAETISSEEIRTHRHTGSLLRDLVAADSIGRPELVALGERCGAIDQ